MKLNCIQQILAVLLLLTAVNGFAQSQTKTDAYSIFERLEHYKQNRDTSQALLLQSAALECIIAEIIENEQALYASIQATGAIDLNSEKVLKYSNRIEKLNFILGEVINTWIPNPDYSFEKQLDQLLNKYPNHPLLLELLSEHYAEKRMYTQAESSYLKLLSIEPRDINGQNGLAQVYENTGRYNNAFRVYMRLVELDLSREASYRSAINMAEKTDQLEKLAERWQQLYRAHKDLEPLKKHLILVWNKLGRNKVRELSDQ
ncbi:MAG: hypothetical protein U5R06_15695 [candidate division KSB1 bacterium]|nr:hypothetical protein [candidate division KSB1 bacterium]